MKEVHEIVPVADEQTTMTAMLRLAIEKGVPVETMEKLVALSERVSDRQAAAEFSEAMARFQEECPPIKRTSVTDYTTKTGARVHYDYAPLKTIAKTVRPILAKHGLSFTWDSTLADGMITARCIISHVNGHKTSASFAIPVEATDRMSASQRTSGAATVARRQSLISALGLTDTDDDDDGADPANASKITPAQAIDLRSLMEEVKADEVRFLKMFGVKSLGDMTQAVYPVAVRQLEAKRGAK